MLLSLRLMVAFQKENSTSMQHSSPKHIDQNSHWTMQASSAFWKTMWISDKINFVLVIKKKNKKTAQ